MKKILIHADAATKADPGLAAVGVQIVDETKKTVLHEQVTEIGNATATTATFAAVAFALEQAAAYFKESPPQYIYVLQLNDEVVKRQLNGEQVVNNPGLVPYFMQIYNLRVEYFRELEVVYKTLQQHDRLSESVKAALDG